MSPITFTESRPTDILANLHHSAAEEQEYLFASHDAGDRDLIVVAWSGDEAVGYLAASDERPESLLIWEHLVVPHFRGQRIGQRLLLEAAKRTPPSSIMVVDPMGVLAMDRVNDYYANLGFPTEYRNDRLCAVASDVVATLGERREDNEYVHAILKRKTPGVVTIDPDASVTDALTLMNESHVGAIVASHDGSRVEGILSERDLLMGFDEDGAGFLERRVGDCITRDVVTATPEDLLVDVMDTMTTRRLRHVPVTEQGRLVGILSVGDFLLFRLEQLDTLGDDLSHRSGIPGG